MNSEIYLVDINVLIEAKNRYYAFNICPGFWDALLYHHVNSRIQSIDKVEDEIKVGKNDDDLKKWVISTIPDSFFNSTKGKDISVKLAEIVQWVQNNNQFTPEAKHEFMDDKKADALLIAYAKTNIDQGEKTVIVTQETYSPDIKSKVKIPNVCKAFNIPCVNTFEMLTSLNTQFVLKK